MIKQSTTKLKQQNKPIHEYILSLESGKIEHKTYYRWDHVGTARPTSENIQRMKETNKTKLFRFETKSSSRLIAECDMDIVKNNRLLSFNIDFPTVKKLFIEHYKNNIDHYESLIQKEKEKLNIISMLQNELS